MSPSVSMSSTTRSLLPRLPACIASFSLTLSKQRTIRPLLTSLQFRSSFPLHTYLFSSHQSSAASICSFRNFSTATVSQSSSSPSFNSFPSPLPSLSTSSSSSASSSLAQSSTSSSSSSPTPSSSSSSSPRLARNRKTALSVTPSAARRLKTLLSHQDKPAAGVRLGVRSRGCNGLSYTMNYVYPESIPKMDEVVQADEGVKVYIDPKALFYVVGSEMDYVDNDLTSEFVFKNPNEKGKCGCGESFNV